MIDSENLYISLYSILVTMLSQKGQEAAPFELLIAVITMTFVIVVGLNAMSTLLRAQCEGKIDQNMEELKTALETVAKGEGKKYRDMKEEWIKAVLRER